MNFAITGANGFVGVHIIHHLLRQGHSVNAIIRPNASKDEFILIKKYYNLDEGVYDNLVWSACELYDVCGLEDVFTRTDYVVHTAGMISYLQKDVSRMMLVNHEYTANVVNIAKDAGVKKLLYCSSIAAISKNITNKPITEDTEWDDEITHSNYGFSKYQGETELWRAQEEGLATVAVNPGIILGYGDWDKGSNKLFKNAFNNFKFYSKGITGFVGVEDVAAIVVKLCLSEIEAERFILVSENKTFKNVADRMAAAFDKTKPAIEVRGLLYKVVYGLISLKEFLGFGGMLSKETVRASVSVNRFSNDKICQYLDYKFESMDRVIDKAAKHFNKD